MTALAFAGVAHARPAPVTWCGHDEVQEDRVPEIGFGPRLRFVYAVPADGQDRLLSVASGIATDAAAIDAWWRSQDSSRTPRFDLYPFPGCAPGFGNLDIGFVRLPHTGAEYRANDAYGMLQADLATTFPTDQKTILYYDGPSSDPRICGEAPVAPASGGRFGTAILFLQSGQGCTMLPVGDGSGAEVAAHEFLHSLGATPAQAPHLCEQGHVCDAATDIMNAELPYGSTLDVVTLDYQRDDYYGHSGSWWDVQDSNWLTHLPQHMLSASIVGSGTLLVRIGTTVVSTCEAGCTSIPFDNDSSVVISALPSPGWQVAGWTGSCTGKSPACSIDGAAADVGATVTFVRAPVAVSVSVVGKGRVTSTPAGISCTGVCKKTFASGTTVVLRAVPAKAWRFAGWSGGCTGRTCTISEPTPRVQARFDRK